MQSPAYRAGQARRAARPGRKAARGMWNGTHGQTRHDRKNSLRFCLRCSCFRCCRFGWYPTAPLRWERPARAQDRRRKEELGNDFRERHQGTTAGNNNRELAMANIQILNPDSLGKPLGQYSQITRVKASEFLFIAGQVGADKDGKAPADFDAQCGLVFANIGAALSSQGASFANLVEFTTYLVHAQDIAKFMAYRTREFPKLFKGGAYPPNTLLIIDRLVREEFLIEVSAVAAL